MLFNSLQFAIFFCAVLVAFNALPPRARIPLLLGSSLLFYTFWLPPHLLLLLLDIAVNYALVRLVIRGIGGRLPVVISIAFTLGLLACFKYAAFAIETALPLLARAGVEPIVPDFFLPLGISFYSFQIVAFSVDVHRGHVEPPRNLLEYALFVCFFPQLIAGPICRGSELLPQIERGGEQSADRTRRGIWLVAVGVGKKVILADFMLSGLVDPVFASPEVASAPMALFAVYGFAFQIYFDFSGYTDIARGLALLLGFELPLNFREPYLSRDPAEFWRRWHITLSRWLRDYLYIPLGGNRFGAARTHMNLLLTMLLGGLWHGAAWTFVVWGGLHGLLLVLHRFTVRRRRDGDRPFAPSDVLRVLLLFHAVCLLWIFFRAKDLANAGAVLDQILSGSYAAGQWEVRQVCAVATAATLHALERFVRVHWEAIRTSLTTVWGGVLEGAALGIVAGLAFAMASGGAEFIYFQF